MEIPLDKINQRQDPYQLFKDSIKAPDTLRKYNKDLYKFLSAIPTKVYQDTLGKMPQDTEPKTLASFFVELARKNLDLAYDIIAAFVKEKKKLVEQGNLNPNSLPNHIKPIKVLLDSNKISLHWKSLYMLYPLFLFEILDTSIQIQVKLQQKVDQKFLLPVRHCQENQRNDIFHEL